MSFVTPLFLALGLLAAPIIIPYMLRLRRREMVVSSTMLWQKLLRDREANAPWQRLRRNLLLFLQLLILGLLVVALARPYLPVPTVVNGSVVVVLDGSASMQATDVVPSRFAGAQEEVGRWINELGSGNQMTLILAGPAPVVLAAATDDRRVLHTALESAQPAATEADWPAALALAAGAIQGARDARLVIVSDGGLPADLPPLPEETIYIPLGQQSENLAISALATRQSEAGPQLFAGVRNTGSRDQQGLLSIRFDGNLVDSRTVALSGGENATFTWDLPAGVATIAAELSNQTEDYLSLDDMAWAVHESGVNTRALIVSPGNIFLEQLFAILPGVEAFRAPPETDLLAAGNEPFDLYVFDSVSLPAPLPAADLLLINPQVEASGEEGNLLTVTNTFSNTTTTRLADSPLLEFVDWSGVHIRQALAVSAPWAQPLISAEGGPLLLIGEQTGQRIALLTFDLHDSDLPLQIAFPILMANLTDWLSPGQTFDASTVVQPGDPLRITPRAGTTHILVDRPDGSNWIEPAGEEPTVFEETEQIGLYTVRLRDAEGDQPGGQFAVNLFSSAESNITPAAAIRIGQTALAETGGDDVGQREFWPWLAAVAVLILALEWWVHFRGARLPRLRKRVS
jgi:hypothetical protein